MKFLAHKKALLSITALCATSMMVAQTVTVPVTLPDTVLTKLVQQHIIQMVNGVPVKNQQPVTIGPVQQQYQPVQRQVVASPFQKQPDAVVVKPVAQPMQNVPQPAATPSRMVGDTIRQHMVVDMVDTIRRVVIMEQQVPMYGAYGTNGQQKEPEIALINGRYIERISRDDLKATFIPKGQWMLGASVNYQGWDNNDTDFLVLKNMNLDGHIFSVSPAFGYFVANNIAIGARYSYSRNYFFLGDFDLNLGEDFNISLKDLYYLNHKHEGSIFMRNYMPLFGSKTFGFFSEIRATYSQTVGKNSTGDPAKENFDGVYEKTHSVGLGFTPGICIFTTNFAALECSIGVMGVNYKWTDQKHYEDNADEPVYEKRSQSGGANFKINIFSVNLGMTLYL